MKNFYFKIASKSGWMLILPTAISKIRNKKQLKIVLSFVEKRRVASDFLISMEMVGIPGNLYE